MSRQFPVLSAKRTPGCPLSIPWELVAPFENQARINHAQSLNRLAERGGLCPVELYYVMHELSYPMVNALPADAAIDWLKSVIAAGGAA